MNMHRPHTLDRDSYNYGIWMATEVMKDYDRYSSHPYLVSECVLGKLNLLKRKPKKNRVVKAERCPARAVFDSRFRCSLERGHRGSHWGPKKKLDLGYGNPMYVRSGFCHGRGERCHHL
jgi:hypothetical protein